MDRRQIRDYPPHAAVVHFIEPLRFRQLRMRLAGEEDEADRLVRIIQYLEKEVSSE